MLGLEAWLANACRKWGEKKGLEVRKAGGVVYVIEAVLAQLESESSQMSDRDEDREGDKGWRDEAYLSSMWASGLSSCRAS